MLLDIQIVQIVGLLFGLFMLYVTFLHQKRGEFTVKEGGFWTIVWTVFIILALFPQIFDPFITGVLKFARMMDFLIVVGFLFIIGFTFYMYTIVRANQSRVERIVRRMAMEKQKK
jgi:hypothetical protein